MNKPGEQAKPRFDAAALCRRFRAAWQRDGVVSIEQWLAGESVELSSATDLVRLLQTEIDLRRERGLLIDSQQLAARFPDVPTETLADLMALPAPPPPPTPRSGPLLPSRYRALEQVGEGGMGDVWRVEDRQLQRMLAIKTLNERNRHRRSAQMRLEREAMLLGGLTHPGIPPVHERGTLLNGIPFFAMKLVEGRTLAQLMAQREYPQDRRGYFLGVFEQIANTMAFAHRQGVIHRDLKPHNVMVGRFGEVQIMDWGMARRWRSDQTAEMEGGSSAGLNAPAKPSNVGADSPPDSARGSSQTPSQDSSKAPSSLLRSETLTGAADLSRVDPLRTMTRDGDVIGTPAYMAPEQARGEARQLNPAADVFSLGAILFEILTGRTPTADVPIEQLLETIRAGEIRLDEAALCDGAGDETLVELCRDCLQPDASKRPTGAGLVAERIALYLQATEQRARRAELEVRAATVRVNEERKRRRLAWALTATIVTALLIGGLTWWWVRNGRIQMAEQRSRDRAAQAVTSIGSASLAGLPYAIENLQQMGPTVLAPLDRAFRDAANDDQALRFLVAKASMGDVETEFLARQIGRVTADGLPLLVEALRPAGPEGTRAVITCGKQEPDIAARMRYWLVATNLGDASPLVDELQYAGSVPARMALLELCPAWWGDLSVLMRAVRETDWPLPRYAVLSAIAEIDPDKVSVEDRVALAEGLHPLATDEHPAVRAAAELVLRRWGQPPPRLSPEAFPLDGDCSWGVNSVGMVMVRMEQAFDDGDGKRMPRGGYAWYVSDREVTEAQFRQFVTEDRATAGRVGEFESGGYKGMYYGDYFANAHPQRLQQPGSQREYPIASIGYYDALRFCNWLSRREGFEPVYVDQSSEKIQTTFGKSYRDEVWVKNPTANGYRLPEWTEHQYMSVGHSHFRHATTFFRSDRRFWQRFAWYLKNTDDVQPVGARLPNRFGLFDVSGNIEEFGDFVRYEQEGSVRWQTLGESFQSPDIRPVSATRGRPLPSIIDAPADGFRVVRCPSSEIAKRASSRLDAEFLRLKTKIARAQTDMETYASAVAATDLAFKFMERYDFERAIEVFRRAIDLSNKLIERDFQTARARLDRGGNRVNIAISLRAFLRLDEAEAMIAAAREDLTAVAEGDSQYRKIARTYLENSRRAGAKIDLSRAAHLACSTFEHERDGERAIALSKQAIEVLGRDDAAALAVLAAAYAEVGDFDRAMAVQEEALAVALENGEPGDHSSRLNYYRNHRPWHDPRIEAPR